VTAHFATVFGLTAPRPPSARCRRLRYPQLLVADAMTYATESDQHWRSTRSSLYGTLVLLALLIAVLTSVL
jgi:hypothetical protein